MLEQSNKELDMHRAEEARLRVRAPYIYIYA
jgi:hypothetical protein